MNKTPSEAVALINELKPLVANDDVDVLFCVPAIDLVPSCRSSKKVQTSRLVLRICILKRVVLIQAKSLQIC